MFLSRKLNIIAFYVRNDTVPDDTIKVMTSVSDSWFKVNESCMRSNNIVWHLTRLDTTWAPNLRPVDNVPISLLLSVRLIRFGPLSTSAHTHRVHFHPQDNQNCHTIMISTLEYLASPTCMWVRNWLQYRFVQCVSFSYQMLAYCPLIKHESALQKEIKLTNACTPHTLGTSEPTN